MRASVDSSFVFATLKRELEPSDQAAAETALQSAETIHVPIVVLEELLRVPGDLKLTEERLRRIAALQLFLLTVETRPLTRQLAVELALLWRKAADAGAKSTTIDTFAAREAVLAQAVMLTCDEAQWRYLERGFGPGSGRFFKILNPAASESPG